jgi:hypothetical protein
MVITELITNQRMDLGRTEHDDNNNLKDYRDSVIANDQI